MITDADVDFTADSVEALMDLMTRDSGVGAVCARTLPKGEGPLYWYQIFEYAIGHWFQKVRRRIAFADQYVGLWLSLNIDRSIVACLASLSPQVVAFAWREGHGLSSGRRPHHVSSLVTSGSGTSG